LAYLFM